jgi:hypothetical protein
MCGSLAWFDAVLSLGSLAHPVAVEIHGSLQRFGSVGYPGSLLIFVAVVAVGCSRFAVQSLMTARSGSSSQSTDPARFHAAALSSFSTR